MMHEALQVQFDGVTLAPVDSRIMAKNLRKQKRARAGISRYSPADRAKRSFLENHKYVMRTAMRRAKASHPMDRERLDRANEKRQRKGVRLKQLASIGAIASTA